MDERDRRPRVRVMDKRRGAAEGEQGVRPVRDAGPPPASPDAGAPAPAEPPPAPAGEPRAEERDAAAPVEQDQSALVDDLRRLQADFDNYRKRMLREQTAMASRASARLVERLLPVLDNLERALEHGEGGPGVELVYKEFLNVLGQEGLEEIEAEGVAFDPHLHDAVQAVDDGDVSEPLVRSVLRKGYRLRDSVLRPAMVIVSRPSAETGAPETAQAAGEEPEAFAAASDDKADVGEREG